MLYLLGGVFVTGLYFLVREIAAKNLIYATLASTTFVAVLVGSRSQPPARRRPWYVLTFGNALAVVGGVIWAGAESLLGIVTPFPSLADLCYLCGGFVFCFGILLLIRDYTEGTRAAAMIDTAIIASGVGVVIGVFLVGPHLADTSRPLPERLIASAYPIMDILLLAVAARLVFGFKRLSLSLWVLVVALLLTFSSDIAYSILVMQDAYQTGHAVNLGWLLAYTLQGALVLHPSIRTAPLPVDKEADLPAGRLPLLASAALTGPAIVAIQTVRGEHINVPVLVTASVLLFLLALGRMRLLAGELRQREARFRALVQHGADGIAIIDMAGLTRYQSPAAAQIVGFAPADLIGANIFTRIHPDDQSRARRIFAELVATAGAVQTCTLRISRAGTEWRHIEIRSANLLEAREIGGIVINYRDITERVQAETLLASQADILERIARNAPLDETLNALALQVEAISNGGLVSIHLLDERRGLLLPIAAPSVPAAFSAAVGDIPVGEGIGSCGTAAARHTAVIVADIATDPLWNEYQELALAHDLRACWSIPILVHGDGARPREQRLLGTFAVYYPTPRQPGEAEWQALVHLVGLTALAIERAAAAAALRDSERDYRELLAQAADAILISDAADRYVEVNARACALTGYSRAELLHLTIADLTPPEEWADLPARRAALPLGGRGLHERTLIAKDGTRIPVEINANRLIDGRLQVIVRDITVRREAEVARHAAEAKYRALVEQLPAITYIAAYGEVGRTLYISPQVETLLGYTPEEYMADPRRWERCLHPDDRTRVFAAMAASRAGGYDQGVEYRLLARDGRELWVRDAVAILRDEAGRPIALQGILLDITERRRAEAALRERDERFHLVARATNDAVWDWDLTTGAHWWNEAITTVFGYPAAALGPTIAWWEEHIHEADREQIRADIRAAIAGTDETWAAEYRFRRADGTAAAVLDRGFILRDERGVATRMLGSMQDLTAHKQAEETLRRSEAALGRAQRLARLGSWEHDLPTGAIWWSDETYRLFGIDPAAGPLDFAAFLASVPAEDRPAGVGYRLDHRSMRPDGAIRTVHSQAEVIRDEAGRPIKLIGSVQDVTARKAMEERLAHQAFHDPLTGLPNRALFTDRVDQALARTRRDGTGSAILFLDLDRFKDTVIASCRPCAFRRGWCC